MENQQQSGGGSGRKAWAAYNIVKRGERSYWNRIGSAFKNHDGSYNILLNSLPIDGKVQIREDADGEARKERAGVLTEQAEEVV